MAEHVLDEEKSNYEMFRDCLSEPVLRTLAAPIKKSKIKKKGRKGKHAATKEEKVSTGQDGLVGDENAAAEDLGEFIDVGPLPSHASLY